MKTLPTLLYSVLVAGWLCAPLLAADLQDIKLPAPKMEGGKPLMQALKERASTRDFIPEKLSDQTLSDLLWAACGVNRPDSGKRTVPSARNWQEINVYVAMESGLYLYDPKAHLLKAVLAEDIRALTGGQPFVTNAPVNLVYVADLSRMEKAADGDKALYSAADTGFISQNVYLFCASEGLATVVRGNVDRKALAAKMGLRADQKIILAQSVGKKKK